MDKSFLHLYPVSPLTEILSHFDSGWSMNKFIVLPFGSGAFADFVDDFFGMKKHVYAICN